MSDVIAMLKAAAMDEHAAIIQYLRHAYSMGEGEEACEIEGIAREEMRHFWMLSRWIVRLGGSPTIERGLVDLAGETLGDWMERDVQAEDRAIHMYRDMLAKIENPDLRADIERILADELVHRGDFEGMAEELAGELPEEADADEAPAPQDVESLGWGVRHEYAAILQYLFHSFLIQDEEVSRQLELQAINEMQHMGWLGEELTESGQDMPLEHHEVNLSQEPQDMLQADIQLEHDTAAMYGQFMERMADPEFKELLEQIRGHELYHEGLFERLLERLVS
ncbi:MAG: ferritin-like domain-containing protein [Chloroflexia bacterium]|nr:ferritin-like domain-containing protein [Chloroflexia bacterium]